MNILIFTSYTPHNEWLEIAQTHLAAGDRVTLMVCDAEMLTCNWNKRHIADRCSKCRHQRGKAIACLEGQVRTVSYLRLDDADRRELNALPTSFASLEQLKLFRVDNFDIGMAVASTLIDLFRNPEFEVNTCQALIQDHLIPAVAIYRSVQHYLDAEPTDRVYLFNGRYAHTRAVMRATQSRACEFVVHENGHDKSHYMLYENDIPHSRSLAGKLILRQWEQAAHDLARREQIARRWFDLRAAGRDVHDKDNDRSYVTAQKPTMLPDGFDHAVFNVAIFNSSEEEWAAVSDEWTPTIYPTQLDGFRRLVADLPRLAPHVRAYLRVHPHLKGIAAVEPLMKLQSPTFTVIPPDSEVSSYGLLKACRTVLTFGSTVGIEAVYFGKPSILGNCSLYEDLDATYNARTHAELLDLLSRPLEPKPIEKALMYGYYQATFGVPFRYYRKSDLPFHEGTMNGHAYQESPWFRALWAILRRTPLLAQYLDRRNRRWTEARLLGR